MSEFSDLVRRAVQRYVESRRPQSAMPPYFPPSPYYARPSSTMRGVPVFVLGRDPPYAGDLLGYQPVFYNGEEWYVLHLGWVEIWAQVRDSDDNIVGYYPYVVRGLPSIGALVAHEHARSVGGYLYLFEVGINEPFAQVTVPARSVLWLDKVFDGTMRAIIADPAGILSMPDYEAGKRLYELSELVRSYSYAMHRLDYENKHLRALLNAKEAEASKYRELAEERNRMYMNLLSTSLELKHTLEQVEVELEQMEKLHIADREYISHLSSLVGNMRRSVAEMIQVLSELRRLSTEEVVRQVSEAVEAVRGGRRQAGPAQQQGQQQQAPAQVATAQQGGGYV